MGVTIEYLCADGTPFPVTFADEAEAAMRWRREDEHAPVPASPLHDSLIRGPRTGAERAYAEIGTAIPSMWRTGPQAAGFAYYADLPPPPDEMAELQECCSALVARLGGTEAVWRNFCFPRVRTSAATIGAAPRQASLGELSQLLEYGFHHTMIPAYVLGNDMRLVLETITGLYDDEAPLVAHELAQGFDSVTVAADQALWDLGRIVARTPALVEALADADSRSALLALRAAGRQASFFAQLDEFMASYGLRAEMWSMDAPTWSELPPSFLAQLRRMAIGEVEPPIEAVRRAAERRKAKVVEIEERLASDPDRLARFRRRLARIACYMPIREERALWQLVLNGSLRHAALRQGQALVDDCVLDDPDDVRFLTVDEVEGPPAAARALVAERRAEYERCSRLLPPVFIGGEPEATAAPPSGEAGVVRGTGASRGVATGPARVVLDLADADRVEPGDILVCTMTSPPWTALFGVVAAVVVDSGDIQSHPAIAAREYGIPCVLGTRDGTTAIPDGAIVTVDGAAGTVDVAS